MTAKATTGRLAPAAMLAKKIVCAGPAHMMTVESTAAPAGKPASRARLPTPRIEKPSTQAVKVMASRAPRQNAARSDDVSVFPASMGRL